MDIDDRLRRMDNGQGTMDNPWTMNNTDNVYVYNIYVQVCDVCIKFRINDVVKLVLVCIRHMRSSPYKSKLYVWVTLSYIVFALLSLPNLSYQQLSRMQHMNTTQIAHRKYR